jgi:hypothetical protein
MPSTPRTTLLRAVYDGILTLNIIPTAAYRLQRYVAQDDAVIVIGDLGGRAHPDDIPGTMAIQRVQLACYHTDPATARAWAQAHYEAFMAMAESDGRHHPWTLTGWTVAHVVIDPPRELGIPPSDPKQRAKVTCDLTFECAAMTSP